MINNAVIPNFLVIGAPKSGTTSLYHWLIQHPDIFMPEVKEPGYFAFANYDYTVVHGKKLGLPPYSREWDAYLKLFESKKSFRAYGECTTWYLGSPRASKLISEKLPDVSMIAVLRNPIERAYSHYLMDIRDGHFSGSFSDAINSEESEQKDPFSHPAHWYKSEGKYATNLKKYFDIFKRSQFRIYLFEDLIKKPKWLVRDIFEFLEVDNNFLPDLSKREQIYGKYPMPWFRRRLRSSSYNHPIRSLTRSTIPPRIRAKIRQFLNQAEPTSKPQIDPDIRKELTEYFASEIEDLQKIINRDLSHWVKSEK
jgi:hypothetical protein